jgi:hypothetical protein
MNVRPLTMVLKELEEALRDSSEASCLEFVRLLLRCEPQSLDFWQLASSLEVWGGSGSMADQAGVEISDLEARRQFYRLMAEFADCVNAHSSNPRARSWGDIFRQWSVKKC